MYIDYFLFINGIIYFTGVITLIVLAVRLIRAIARRLFKPGHRQTAKPQSLNKITRNYKKSNPFKDKHHQKLDNTYDYINGCWEEVMKDP